MRKNVIFTALAAMMVLVLASCTDNKELLANMVGTYTDNDPEEKVTIQFYPSTDGHTGRFIESREYLVDGDDNDGIEVNVHATAYITGTYTLTDERHLSYKYDIDELSIFYDTEEMEAYAQRNIDHNNANNNCFGYQGHSLQEVAETLSNSMANNASKSWTEFYEGENKDFETLSYGDVQCDGKTLTFNAGGSRATYTRLAEDMFKADFFDEDKADAEEKPAEEETAE